MVSTDHHEDVLPLEFLNLPDASHGAIDDALPILVQIAHDHTRDRDWGFSYSDKIQGESTGSNWVTLDNPNPRDRLKAWGQE